MAKNTGDGYRQGSVTDRTQTYNPKNDTHVKRDTSTGKFIDHILHSIKFLFLQLFVLFANS